MELIIDKKETPEGVFYYSDLGAEMHGMSSFRLWVSSKLVIQNEDRFDFIGLPAKAIVCKTPKGNFVLKPNDEYLTFTIGKKCGYRGGSWYDIITKHEIVVPFEIWDSPRGNLGVSRYALVSVAIEDMPLKYRWTRSGRLYGSEPVGITIVEKDGTSSTVDGVDAIDELKSLL